MIQHKASVIIPCHNVEDYVAECLDSVRAQGAVVYHVYCVNNNSSDRTAEAIERWIAQHPEIPATLLNETKPGACAARNAPLEQVDTEWIQFLDADDLLLPGKLERQIAEAAADTGVIFDSSIKRLLSGEEIKKETDPSVLVGLMASNLGNTCANLFKTEAIRSVEGWNEELSSSQEYDLMYRLYSRGTRFQRLDTARTVIRERPSGQISQQSLARRKRNSVDLREQMMESVDLDSLSTEERQRLMGAFFLSLHWLFRFDSERAIRLYERHLTSRRFEIRAVSQLPPGYALVFSLLGFARTERLRLATRHIRMERFRVRLDRWRRKAQRN